jgi:hypothetical protein
MNEREWMNATSVVTVEHSRSDAFRTVPRILRDWGIYQGIYAKLEKISRLTGGQFKARDGRRTTGVKIVDRSWRVAG